MNGMQVTSLAREYGVSKSYCSRIVRNLAYFDPAYDYTQKRKGLDARLVFNLRNQGLTYREIAERTATATKKYTEAGLAYIYKKIKNALENPIDSSGR